MRRRAPARSVAGAARRTTTKLAWILWLASVLPPQQADSLCLSATVYLEARDQSRLGQQAVAEVALRRRDSGQWGRSVCEVVTARRQFAPALVPRDTRLDGVDAWAHAVTVAIDAERNWALPRSRRVEVVPGASHFAATAIASPSWRNAYQVATIGDHTFYRVQRLRPRDA